MKTSLLEAVSRRLLRENVEHDVVRALIVWKGNDISKIYDPLMPPAPSMYTKMFFSENAETWMDIITSFGNPRPIPGQGATGLAMLIDDDKVLKIELIGGHGGEARGPLFREALKGNTAIAKWVPMVYDHGTFKADGKDVMSWFVMERVVTPGEDLMRPLSHILVHMYIDKGKPKERVLDDIQLGNAYAVKEIQEDMAAKGVYIPNDWTSDLYDAYKSLKGAGHKDLNTGNIGFRRTTGKPVFFDT